MQNSLLVTNSRAATPLPAVLKPELLTLTLILILTFTLTLLILTPSAPAGEGGVAFSTGGVV